MSVTSAGMSGLRFSVVVPTYNRPLSLAACVGALSEMEEPSGGFEIVVVNDGGVPPPEEVIATALRSGGPRDVRVIEQRNAGPAAARNAGAAAARGRCIAFTDDDCLPERQWLVAFDAALTSMPQALVGGRTVNAITGSVYADASQQLADFVSAYFDGTSRGRFFTSNNIALLHDAFFAAGAFDSSFPFSAGEDREFCDRWSAQHRPSATAGDAVVRHVHVLTAARFVRQHFTYGRGARTFRGVRAASGRPVAIDLTFYARSIRNALSRGYGARGPVFAALTILAHAAYGGGLLWQSLPRVSRRSDA